MVNKDQGLQVELKGGTLLISIGVSALCTAVKAGPGFEADDGPQLVITDEDVFVRAIVAELEREEEDGSTRIHRMLDGAAEEALEQGAEGVEYSGDD